MSDNDPKGQAERSRDQDPTLINARLQWVADLVGAILNAESIKRSVKSPPVRLTGDHGRLLTIADVLRARRHQRSLRTDQEAR